MTLRDKNFDDLKFNFSIVKVIDGRLNKQKPIGSLTAGFSFNKETVGNDSLGEQMTLFFKNKPNIFDASTKVILIINQLNLRYIRGTNEMGGKKEELEVLISLDYYLAGEKTSGLLYQQYYKHRENVTFVAKVSKGINVAVSEALINAMTDFKNQINENKVIVRKEFSNDSLFQFFANKPTQVITNQNINDGIYFSIKDLYLNKPGVVNNYYFNDSTAIGQKSISVKSTGYKLDRVYAIVKSKRLFIYIGGGNYKEALLSDDGKLFFPDITSSNISSSARGGSAAVGIASAFLPLGFIGGIVTSATQSAIKSTGTTKTTSDVIVDFDTGDLIFKGQ